MNFFRKNRVRNGTYDDPAYGTHVTNPGTYGTNTGPALDRTHPTAVAVHPNTGYTATTTSVPQKMGGNISTGGGPLHRDSDLEYGNEKPRNHAKYNITSGNFNRRPKFGQWLKSSVIDILTMIAMGAVGLGIYNADPAPSRSFPVTYLNGNIVYPEFAYPLRRNIIPIWLAALLASVIPIVVFLIMQIRIKSFWDVNNAIIGLLYSLITAAVFQVFIKWLIGGLRPHFLDVCQPDVNLLTLGGNGFRSLMYNRDVCTGDRKQINDSLESMPSGHSTAAFAGFIFLYLYLNAKLKIFANYHPAMWKLIVVYAPVLGACLIAGSLTIDAYHNWYDCLAGAVIGTVMAFSAYRMVYASVWDFRFNHIPLTRHTPFSYGAGAAGAGGFESAVFTRKAGWGYEEAYGGAPFDAAHHLRGTMTGFNNTVHQNGHTGNSGGSGGGGGGIMNKLTHRNQNKENDSRHSTDDRDYNQRHSGAGTTTTAAALEAAADRHHHDRNSRLDNHHHNQTINQTVPTSYPTNTTTIAAPAPQYNTPYPTTAYPQSTAATTTTTTYPTQMTQTAYPDPSHQRNSGLYSQAVHSDNYPNNNNDYSGTGILPASNPNTRYQQDGGYNDDGSNRYRIHSRSLERKAVPRTQQDMR